MLALVAVVTIAIFANILFSLALRGYDFGEFAKKIADWLLVEDD